MRIKMGIMMALHIGEANGAHNNFSDFWKKFQIFLKIFRSSERQ